MGTSTTIAIVAGELSGDLYGASLAKEIRDLAPEIELFGIGGERMEQAGVSLRYRIEKLAFMGVVEVVRHLRFLHKVMFDTQQLLKDRRPDVLVTIDYPGFNLLLAEAARRCGIPVVYYIPPKVWAWGRWRLGRMKRSVSRVVCILPFEIPMYRRYGLDARFVGHPLLELIGPGTSRETFRARWNIGPDDRLIGLLPGSRRQEVERLLPKMLQAVQDASSALGGVTALISRANTVEAPVYDRILDGFGERPGVILHTVHDLMRHSDLLLVASGTATLEAAILGTPMVILYSMAWLSYGAARLMVRVPYIGLPNLILGRKVVPELIQRDACSTRIAKVVCELLGTDEILLHMRRELGLVRDRLGQPGASRRTARMVLEMVGWHCQKRNDNCRAPVCPVCPA